MNKLEKEIEFLSSANKIIIGLSGGADSVALTHILFKAFGTEKLICAHVNHMIRGEEADRDTDFCQSYCDSLGIELRILRKDVPLFAKENHLGEEEAGRKIRYDFFESLIQSDTDAICTAHNADDNAETVLLNLTRGTGLKGLCGIPQSRGRIFRPILKMSRVEIEAYCEENKLSYITDSTNLADEYNRNKIRHTVIPALKEINSGLIDNILRMCENISVDESYIECKANELVKAAKIKYGYDAKVLAKAEEAVLNRAIIMISEAYKGVKLEKKHIDSIKSMLDGGSCDVPVNMSAAVSQGVLFFYPKNAKLIEEKEVKIGSEFQIDDKFIKISCEITKNSKKIHNLLFNNFADYDKIRTNKLSVSARKEGDKFTVKKRNITKPLKKLYAEAKIPAQLRDRIIVIRDGDTPVFVEGFGVNAGYLPDENTTRVIEFSVNKV